MLTRVKGKVYVCSVNFDGCKKRVYTHASLLNVQHYREKGWLYCMGGGSVRIVYVCAEYASIGIIMLLKM